MGSHGVKISRDSAEPTRGANVARKAIAEKEAVQTSERRSSTCPIVAIGASAGGLNAFKEFLTTMPADSGMAFVLIPHLDPTHESLMVELLSKQTRMPVEEASDGMEIEANRVYIIPPNRYLAVKKGVLELSAPPEARGFQTAIDFGLRSLAEDQGENAVGIILSGTGSHGTRGIKEIKLAGGTVVAQTPDSAEYDQMPRSAIETGLVDFVLPPEDMPAVLIGYARHAYLNRRREAQRLTEEASADLNSILAVLRARTNYDFRCYRKNMLMRRVQRRMGLLHLEEVTDYVKHLRQDEEEAVRLYKDLLIGVTAFFREPEAFSELARCVLPELVEKATAELPIRAWVAGCATGEEAYSISMLLHEQFARADKTPCIQIYATDIDEDSLGIARRGIYPDSVVADVSPERLRRFFTGIGEHRYEVSKQLRESIVFAPQNIISDAPFSRLDLVSCRNLLIYLEPEVQKKIISLFHFALNDGGYLLLGPSETIGRASDQFEPVSKKWRVFRRIGPVRHDQVDIPILASKPRYLRFPEPGAAGRPRPDFPALLQRALLQNCAPAAVLIDRHHQILAVQGPVVNYLEFPAGELTKDLLTMVRHGLRMRVRAVCHEAVRDGQAVTQDGRVKRNGTYVPCTIGTYPLSDATDSEGLLLVVFQERAASVAAASEEMRSVADTALVQQIEDELRTTREDLQSTIEELESSNEELKASNEEIMSMNEELQSANEELETSKEELQSLNEELNTVNNELRDKVDELEKSNDDIVNLMASTDVATVFIDTDMRIQRFTPATARLLNLMAGDIGRPLADLAPKFVDKNLIDECRQVIEQLAPLEEEIRGLDGSYYLRRILPYRTADNRINGVVITFVDITGRVAAEQESRRLATVLLDSNDAVTVQDFEGRIISWNRGAERMYGYGKAEALNMKVHDLIPSGKTDEMLAVVRRVASGETVESFETQRKTRDGRILDVWITLTRIDDEAGKPVAVATTERDVTERNRAEAEIRELNLRLEKKIAERSTALRTTEEKVRAILETASDAIISTDDKGNILSFNTAAERMFGYAAEEAVGANVEILIPTPVPAGFREFLTNPADSEKRAFLGSKRELPARHKDGSTIPVEVSISEVDHLNLYSVIAHDISERKQMQRDILNIATQEQQSIGRELHDGTQQELTGLGLLAQNLADPLQRQSAPEAELAVRLANGIAAAGRRVRQLAKGLIPVPVDSEGLMMALDVLAEETAAIQNLDCTFECPEPVIVNDDLAATHLYRIAQEAVTNALKHARADKIVISLRDTGGSIRLEVHDNGVGIDEKSNATPGVGLKIMGYRCNLINGSFDVRRGDGGGTIVSCRIRQQAHVSTD